MKTKLLITIALCLVFSFITYKLGENKGMHTQNEQLRYDIVTRYYNVIGMPSTQEQQCTFERIIYNDSSECN